MKLRDLEAYFTKYRERDVDMTSWEDTNAHPGKTRVGGYHEVTTLAEADGIWFLCPKCFIVNGGDVGTHMVMVGFRDRCPPGSYTQNKDGQDTRWAVIGGSGMDDLQLTPSISIEACCGWHGFVGSSNVPPGEAA
jgi:hypothetical protein